MRNIVTPLIMALLLAACSSPKYTYYFDHYDYNSGKKEKTVQENQLVKETTLNQIDDITLTASSNEDAVYVAETTSAQAISKEEAITKFNSLSKEEKKEVKRELKKYVKENKNVLEAHGSGLSGDLKLAAIFGIIGIVLLIIGGDVIGVLGTIALLVGLFFLVRYLINH